MIQQNILPFETAVSAAATVNVMGEVAVIIPTISPNEGRQKVFKHIYVDLGQGELRDADDEKLKIHKIWFSKVFLKYPTLEMKIPEIWATR